MIVGLIASLLAMLAGDLSAKFLHQEQPEKLAAIWSGILKVNQKQT